MVKKKQKQLPATLASMPEGYQELLDGLKKRIRQARIRAGLAVNQELIKLYWQNGRDIWERQKQRGWGAKVIERLSVDLRHEFPEMRGLSPRNLQYMRTFAEAWPDLAIAQQLVAQIPWGHNCILLDKLKDPDLREWYARMTIENGWSRNVLVIQIESDLYRRLGTAQTNFENTLPAPQSDLARQILKDPYNFEFLSVGKEAQEREIEQALVDQIRDVLLELGVGFAFVGNQYRLKVGEEEFYLDILFYHLKLRCFVVVELKAGKFKPEYAGKLNFYLTAVDKLLRHPDDQPSIGIMLCKGRDRVVAEYALQDIRKPIGVSQYELPAELKDSLPTKKQLEERLDVLIADDEERK